MTNKNFDAWSEQKKTANKKIKTKWVRDREVWWCALGVNIGTEVDGRGEKFLRPVLIVKKCGLDSALVVPLTSKHKVGAFYVSLGKLAPNLPDSTANLGQIRIIDTKRCYEKIGRLSPDIFLVLKKAIREFLE
jgi:mRNA interferase MazF